VQVDKNEQSSDIDLKPLLARITENNDGDAFDELYFLLEDQLFRFIVSRIRDRARAKDILQDVFVDIWKSLQSFSYRSDAEFYGLIFLITKRKIIRYIEIEKKNDTLDLEENLDIEELEDGVDRTFILEAVKSLKDKYREVVELRYWSGLSFREIGEMVGAKEESVRVRHHRALKMLGKYYKKYEQY
jgi:RNA polymerase sigma-70 factor (ECF subfamily)